MNKKSRVGASCTKERGAIACHLKMTSAMQAEIYFLADDMARLHKFTLKTPSLGANGIH
ncbi:MAG: hypothetical protein F6K24_34160 [Okeania sp. SIO2D1]|nr:hypothetical protein [Okeania sp. SIO2D1]